MKHTRKWARLTMVQAMPGEQPKTERTINQEKNSMSIYVVHTPGYVNHSVFLFRSAGIVAFTYRFAIIWFSFSFKKRKFVTLVNRYQRVSSIRLFYLGGVRFLFLISLMQWFDKFRFSDKQPKPNGFNGDDDDDGDIVAISNQS